MKKSKTDKKMPKPVTLKTRRLRLTAMTDEELEATVAAQSDPDLRQAYTEMLDGCRQHPEDRLWYAPWRISLKAEPQTVIGDAGFKGTPQRGAVEIGYGLEEAYRGQGYMTEAARALSEWAFYQKDVYLLYAETAPDNAASQRVLKKLGFVPCGEGEEGPRFLLEKQPTSFLAIYLCIGMSVGMSLGVAQGNMTMGMCLGMPLGLCLGLALDRQEKVHRAEVTGRKEDA